MTKKVENFDVKFSFNENDLLSSISLNQVNFCEIMAKDTSLMDNSYKRSRYENIVPVKEEFKSVEDEEGEVNVNRQRVMSPPNMNFKVKSIEDFDLPYLNLLTDQKNSKSKTTESRSRNKSRYILYSDLYLYIINKCMQLY